MVASEQGHEAVVVAPLRAGSDANLTRELDKVTALMLASQGGHGAIVEALLRAGAEVDSQRVDGSTASQLAVSPGGPFDDRERISRCRGRG